MYLTNDFIYPATLTGYVRQALSEYPQNQFTLTAGCRTGPSATSSTGSHPAAPAWPTPRCTAPTTPSRRSGSGRASPG
jgi:hypothetical protein